MIDRYKAKFKHKLVKLKKSKLWQKLPTWLTKDRGFFGNSWQRVHNHQIQARTLPPTFGLYLVNLIYRHKFGLPLIIVLSFSVAILFLIDTQIVQDKLNNLIKDDRAKGTFLLALMSTPAIIYTWFIRAHERTLTIQKEEDELWSNELNNLINQAIDSDKTIALRLVAIRQMQDYLSGAKWKANQAANTSAILEAFSSIIDQLEQQQSNLEQTDKNEHLGKIASRLLDVIGSVMRGAFTKQGDKRVLQVIGNNMSELNLSHLNLENVDFSSLKLDFSKFNYSNLDFINLNHSQLNDAELNRARLNDAELNYAELNRARLNRAELNNAKLNRAKLNGAELNGAELNRAELNEAKLNGAELNGAELIRAKLIEAKLIGAELIGAELNDAELNYAELNYAKLNDAELTGAKLIGAKLNGAKLNGAKLNEAKLIGAELNRAELTRADLRNVAGLTESQLTKANYWQKAYRDEHLACGEKIPVH